MTDKMKTVFSGIQPSGNLHLGNYLGSIANWIELQNRHNCIFGIMDMHAITIPQNPKQLQQNILDCAITYLASGIDNKKSTIFVQSDVEEHTQLAWILSCLTPLGWLNRMTQFKDKTRGDNQDLKKLGLYAYPTLMAADILLYHPDLVPTGEDQKQHIELTRDIAGAFNRQYNNEFFKLPEPMIVGNCIRIMSLLDGTKKMSKSDDSDFSRINLQDDAGLISKKIKKSKTDSIPQITYDQKRPEIFNLLNIFSAFTGKKPEIIAAEYENSGFGKFKNDLAENIIIKLHPIQDRINQLKNNLDYVKQVLKEGQQKASTIAQNNMKQIKQIVGLSL